MLSIKIQSVYNLFVFTAKQLNLVPRSSRLTVQFSDNYAVELTLFFRCRKLLPIWSTVAGYHELSVGF